MKIKAISPLFQFGVKAYKGAVVEVSDKLAKELIKRKHATEVDSEDKPLSEMKMAELKQVAIDSNYPQEEWEKYKSKKDLAAYIESKK